MLHLRKKYNVIIAFIIFFSIIAPVNAETLLMDGSGFFLTTGDSWDFYQGYVFTVRSVNLEQKQVWVKLLHDDELLKEQILSEGDMFVYSKDEEILNITVDTIYVSSEGELIIFKPVYQYQDNNLPEPDIPDEQKNENPNDQSPEPGNNGTGKQIDGFTIFQTIACISFLIACRRILN